MRILLAVLLLVAACTPLRAEDDGGPEATWQGAWIAFSAEFAGGVESLTVKSMAAAMDIGAKAQKSWPAVVYNHGCKGHGYSSRIALKVLSDAGFVVIAPNSFARKNRPETCDTKRKRRIAGSPGRAVTAMRFEEIAYAATATPKLQWVDQQNLFIYGHSQGGRVVSAYSGEGFKAVATSGSRCPAGVGAPADKPGIYMNAARDPWFHGKPPPGKCQTSAPQGALHTHPVYDTNKHVVLALPEAQMALINFLKANLD